jgi:hypothetical protein
MLVPDQHPPKQKVIRWFNFRGHLHRYYGRPALLLGNYSAWRGKRFPKTAGEATLRSLTSAVRFNNVGNLKKQG